MQNIILNLALYKMSYQNKFILYQIIRAVNNLIIAFGLMCVCVLVFMHARGKSASRLQIISTSKVNIIKLILTT